MSSLALTERDALVVVDVQNDFITGTLPVPGAAAVVPAMNRYLALFARCGLPVFATRDWHPPDHCSFRSRGGPWPPHCVAQSEGARFAPGLALPRGAIVISKGTAAGADSYSDFEGTSFDKTLRALHIGRLLVGGIATDYCVKATVLDACRLGYGVLLLRDAIRAVNVNPGDGDRAEKSMLAAGAIPIVFDDLALADVA